MNNSLLPFLFIFLPSLILLYITTEIYVRNPKGNLHRMTALLVFSYFLMFMCSYLVKVLPEDQALFVLQYIKSFVNFLSMASTLAVILMFCKTNISSVLRYAIAMLPLAGYACFLFAPHVFEMTLAPGSLWRLERHSPETGLLTLGLTVYTYVSTFSFLASAYRRLKTKPWIVQQKKWMVVFLWSSTLTLAWVGASELLISLLPSSSLLHEADFMASYATFITVLAFRYAMNRYDFLASSKQRYEIIFDNAPIGIGILDQDWNLVDANSRYLRILGLHDKSDQFWRNKKSMDLITYTDNKEENFRIIEEAWQQKKAHRIEGGLRNSLNENYYVEVTGDFFEADGQLLIVTMIKDITEQKKNEENLLYLAYHDPLTELSNRRSFYEQLAEELARLEESDGVLAVLLIDLDHFKWINDTLGHSAGDELLQSVAMMIRGCISENSFVARLGGDEFVVLLPALSSEVEAKRVAMSIQEKLSQTVTIQGHLLQTTASIGISFAPRDGRDAESILKSADAAMYAAKKEGRDQFLLSRPEQQETAKQALVLANGLRSALERDEFAVYFQPQVDLRTGRLIGAEALLRWHSAELGRISPAEFIPVAEETGLIAPIGQWVLQAAIREGKQWLEAGNDDLILSVNVSARQLKEPQLLKDLAELLQAYDFPAHHLCLEITESTAILDWEHALQVCQDIVDLGVRLAIDDFGTGYSSLGMLSHFPFRTVKVDKSLIRDIESSCKAAAVIQTIVNLSYHLDMVVLAEGVETKAQYDLLRRLGCHQAQGFFLHRPMTAEKFYASMKKQEQPHVSSSSAYQDIEVSGASMVAFLEGMGGFRSVAASLLAEGGLEPPTLDQWYPLPQWLNIFQSVSQKTGPVTLWQIGKVVSENALWPADIDNIETALASIDVAHNMNHRGAGLGEIGGYHFSKTGEHSAKLVCDNPYPCDFDRGIIEAMANKYKAPAATVSIIHEDNGCRKKTGQAVRIIFTGK